jgi:outer membrane protein OmpA-like peptidoglycan-associated protein
MAQSRADAAKKFLTEKGVESTRVQALGMGAEKGSGAGQRIENYNLSRRVDIEIRNSFLSQSDGR